MAPDDRSGMSEALAESPPRAEAVGRGDEWPAGTTGAATSPARDWALVLVAGFLAGLIGFGIGEVAPAFTPIDMNLPPEINASQAKRAVELKARAKVSRNRTAALTYGSLGMLVGAGLGLAGGLVRRSLASAIGAALAGLVLGGAGGAAAPLILLPAYDAAQAARPDDDVENNLLPALVTHAGMWAAVGVAGGLALGLGLGGNGRIARAGLGGLLAGILAAVIYEFAGAIAFPTAQTFRPMALAREPRMLAHLTVALCVAAGAFGMADFLKLGQTKSADGAAG